MSSVGKTSIFFITGQNEIYVMFGLVKKKGKMLTNFGRQIYYFLSIILNMCFLCAKEPSQPSHGDGSFENHNTCFE